MKILNRNGRVVLFSLFLLTYASCQSVKHETSDENFMQVYRLIKQTDYFSASELYDSLSGKMTAYHRLLSEAFLNNAFNQLEESNRSIGRLLNRHKASLSPGLSAELYRMRQENYSRLYKYKEAAASTRILLDQYIQQLDSTDIENYSNSLKIWSALQHVPAQEVIMAGELRAEIHKDRAGLDNLRVNNGQESELFVFDTGANLSTVTRSTAEKFNMQIIDADIKVGTITGQKVSANLAVAGTIFIENTEFHNVVFLVLEDEQLSFPQHDYFIHGIIGFPVFEALGEIHIYREGLFIVPMEKEDYQGPSNLAFNHFSPLIRINGRHYNLDTGADHSLLFKRYLNENREAIEEKYMPSTFSFGGAAGAISMQGYIVDFEFVMNNKEFHLENIRVLSEDISKKWEEVYGNLGQDLIGLFDKMVINFRSMFIRFE